MTTLVDQFRRPANRSQFYAVTEMVDALSRLAVRRRLTIHETMDAVLLSLVALVQAAAPTEEWDSVGRQIADEVRRRLTVTGDTGDDHYSRRMV